MKKIVLALILMVGFAFIKPQKANAQAVGEGDVLVDVYYGFPNLWTAVLKSGYANSGSEEDVEISGIGPVGLRGEYMFGDRVGFGLEVNYTNSSVSYRETSVDTTGKTIRYDYKVSAPRLRIMPRFSFHFGNSDAFDGYAAVAAGYNNTTYKFESNDPDYEDEAVKNLIPIAFRLSVGGRYFFTDNIGIHMEIGLGGGGLLSGGLSMKF